MNETDFSICPFIKENMWFFTYEDFCENRKILKQMYQKLKDDGKQFYKWYVYANINMGIQHKNKIWAFLNGEVDEIDLVYFKRKNKK